MPEDLISISDLPCCPEVTKEPCCDRLLYTYRMEYNTSDTPVEVVMTFEIERCPGPLAIGDLVYSTTLLPGEKVRLYTSNRNSRFTFDRESEVSYRHEHTSEETFYMSSMDRFMSDLTVTDQGGGSSESSGSFRSEGGVSGAIESFLFGPSAEASGSYNAQSSFDFARELRSHAESSHERSVNATRASSSVSIGEVQSRTHAEGESESAFEASTRVIENRNECHAVTYFAYQLVKRQTVRFRVRSVRRRIKDQAVDTRVTARPPQFAGAVSVIPQGVLATSSARLSAETAARTSTVADRLGIVSSVGDAPTPGTLSVATASRPLLSNIALANARTARPVAPAGRKAALEAVDKDLVAAGILDKVGGEVAAKFQAEISLELTTCLPTPAIVVKGCIDDCDVCEPTRLKSIELDLKRKELENKLLEKQISILEKSHEYRCCPAGETEDDDD